MAEQDDREPASTEARQSRWTRAEPWHPRFGDFHRAADYIELVPLRIPGGWRIGWNRLLTASRVENGDFGGSTCFYAENVGRRFNIDVEFRPEHDPDGAFYLYVRYQPWPRTERGRRRKDEPFAFDADAELVHSFETRDYAELIENVERWIARCTIWVPEEN